MPSLKTYIKLAILEAHGGQPVIETEDFIAGAFYMLKYLQRHTAMDIDTETRQSYEIFEELRKESKDLSQSKNRKEYETPR